MKGHLAKYLKRSSLLGGARIFYISIVLFLFYYYPRNLSKSIFAQYQQIFILVSFGSSLLAVGLYYIIGLLQRQPFAKQVVNIVKRAKWFYIITSIVILGRLLSTKGIDVALICSIIFLIASAALYAIAEAVLIKHKEDRFVFTMNILYALAFLGVHILLIPYSGINTLIAAWAGITAARTLAFIYKIYKIEAADGNAGYPIPDVLYKQWQWLAANDSVELVNTYLDKLLLSFFISNELFAVYIMGTYEIPIFTIIIAVIGFQFNVQHEESHTDEHILSLFKSSTLFIACGLFPLFIYFFLHCQDIFHFLFGDKYEGSIELFRFTTFLIPLRIANYVSIIQVKKQSKYVLYGSLLSIILYIGFIALLYPKSGLMGIVYATLISTYLQILYYLVMTGKILGLPFYKVFPFGGLLLVLGINVMVMGIAEYIIQNKEALPALLNGIIPLVLCIAINYWIVYKIYIRKAQIA